jgi:hypothetical protein
MSCRIVEAMLKLLPLIAILGLVAALFPACDKPEPPEPTPPAIDFPNAIPVRYYEECRGCGAAFRVESLATNESRQRFQLKLTIENTGERGDLDFSTVASMTYALDGPQSEQYSSRFEAERRAGRATNLLRLQQPPAYTLSHFLDSRGQPSAGPVLAAGETWEGWLVFSGVLPQDIRALVLSIGGIFGAKDGDSRTWISYASGQPFIVVGER